MVLIDKNGNPVRTQLTESVQMRVYRALHPDLGGTAQDFLEFRMSRQRLLSEQEGGLRAVAPEERDFAFPLFREHVPGDPFERDTEEPPWRIVLLTCSSCHTFTGIYSFISYSRARFGAGVGTPPKLVGSNPDAEAAVQIGWIAQHYKLALAAP
jgi:hypothetical protein